MDMKIEMSSTAPDGELKFHTMCMYSKHYSKYHPLYQLLHILYIK